MPDQTGASNASPHATEDAFFVLRDCREHFQSRLVEIARLSGIASPSILNAFSREIGEAHDELASASRQDGFEQTAGLTASRISLVKQDDLDLDIRIGDIASHLKGNDRIESWRVQLRYMSLLHRPAMAAENNPVGLGPICRGLWVICTESSSTLDQKLDQLDRLEEQLQARLPEVYTELNGLLEQHRVDPAPVQILQKAGGGKPEAGSGEAGSGGTGIDHGLPGNNALATLLQVLRQQNGSEKISPAESFAVYASGNSAGESGTLRINASTQVMLNQLMERLSALELQQISGDQVPVSGAQRETRPLRALRAKDLDLPLGKPVASALDTLSLIFEAIFDAPDLPDAVKTAIGRLQIPLLKFAMLDASFFSDPQHPARRLVNRMARAAIGLAQDTGHDHPVCIGLAKVADAVRNMLERHDASLTRHLDELDALIVERDRALQANAQPYAQLVLEYETREEASRSVTQNWLSKALGKTSEPAIRTFLTNCWLRVMQAAYLEDGKTGARWQEYEAIITELLWSVQPKPSADERRQLVTLIPSLMKRINARLDLVKISRAERAPFLDTCFELHTAALRSRAESSGVSTALSAKPLAPPGTPMLAPLSAGGMAEPVLQLLEKDGKLVQYLGLPGDTPSQWSAGSHVGKEGNWISFHLPDGEHLCGRYCWQGAPSGTILLFNTDWGYAVALAPSFLEQQLRSGLARVVSDASLFDEAAERALGQLSARTTPAATATT